MSRWTAQDIARIQVQRIADQAALRKYRNNPTEGYASKKEAKRAAELKLMQRAGEIRDLREQVRYEVIPEQYSPSGEVKWERPCHYVADFTYYRTRDGKFIVEDVKGKRTSEYIMKRKLMLHVHGIRILET